MRVQAYFGTLNTKHKGLIFCLYVGCRVSEEVDQKLSGY